MKLKTLLLAVCVASTTAFAQKVKYSKEERKEMNRYLFNEGFDTASDKKVSTIILKDKLNTRVTVNRGKNRGDRFFPLQLKMLIQESP
ncbi:hypothetical protein [Chryseobacterium oranimense]|uniref:hypothetical protein n=1 Tax=Chryseobacterium oranimense TaxID=421058 RepID=UPI002235B5FB|nr:hypothetical protein [Chryseobacterium oranimense]